MFKLIKLEFYKGKFKGNIIAFFIILLSALAFAGTCGSIVDEGDQMFTTAEGLLEFGELLFRICFGIFAGVMISKFIISEYKSGTINTLFTYPVSRKKVMGCKLCIVFFGTFFAILLADFLFGIGMSVICRIFYIIPDEITAQVLISRIPTAIFGAAATAGLSMIPLYFGMRKKSTSATIVASVVISSVMNSSFGNTNAQESVFSFTLIPVLFCIIGLGIAYWSYRNIDVMDL